jgi:hypothetical protein
MKHTENLVLSCDGGPCLSTRIKLLKQNLQQLTWADQLTKKEPTAGHIYIKYLYYLIVVHLYKGGILKMSYFDNFDNEYSNERKS